MLDRFKAFLEEEYEFWKDNRLYGWSYSPHGVVCDIFNKIWRESFEEGYQLGILSGKEKQ